ncbi:MAG: FAD-dependent oxidoreductase [Opitutaceae bacterium]|nr:FAD-dependent oxidoreductase [Opitutaceae bacterium]
MSNPINSYPNSWYVASSPMLAEQRHASGDLAYDVCVVGGGYTGLSCALHLATAGKSVAVLEAERVGWGASGRNGGHVGTGQRADQHSLEKWYGKATARELWRLGLEAVDLVTDLIEENDINCELGTTNIHFAAKKSHVDELRDEVDYLRNQYDYHQISGVESSSLEELTSGIGFHYGVIDHGARHLHPLKYCLGLAAAAMKAGASIFEKSQVKNIDIRRDLAIVTTDKAVIKAQRVVLACNGYLGNLFQPIAGNIMPINNFIVATEPLDEATANRINPLNASMSDSLFVINYWKLSEDRRLIFGGGETYSDKFPVSITDFVRPQLLAIYPELSDVQLIYGWGGTLAITRNRMPDLGVHKGVVYYAQGFSGHGVPTATMAGKLIAAAIDSGNDDFDLMSGLKTLKFPGGPLLRRPSLVAGMLFYSLRDRIGQ